MVDGGRCVCSGQESSVNKGRELGLGNKGVPWG